MRLDLSEKGLIVTLEFGVSSGYRAFQGSSLRKFLSHGDPLVKESVFHIVGAEAALHEIHTRMPFRYGNACLTASPVLVVRVTIEAPDGSRMKGLSSDCLPPRWFDKDPGKDYRQNVEDQLEAYRIAREAYLSSGDRPRSAFAHWSDSFAGTRNVCAAAGLNGLTASFGSSFFERAMIDGLCRLHGKSFFEALRANLLGFETSANLPDGPTTRIGCRHTVGLADPITVREIPDTERIDDGLPQALEECISFYGLRYFKVKVSGDHDRDLGRLGRMAKIFGEQCGEGYSISLDGNEQYRDLGQLEGLLEALRSRSGGERFVESILYIEQPLAREVALQAESASDVRRLAKLEPVIIDESDESLDSFSRAVDLGYRGTSHKNCKGIFKSLLNLALLRKLNRERAPGHYFLTAEDLANTAVLPLQQDLASLAALGIEHAERNGHHYFHGLDHLPAREARSALEAHPELYRRSGDSIFLRVEDGLIDCRSLQCVGYGYAGEIAFDERTPLEEWRFERLEISGDRED